MKAWVTRLFAFWSDSYGFDAQRLGVGHAGGDCAGLLPDGPIWRRMRGELLEAEK